MNEFCLFTFFENLNAVMLTKILLLLYAISVNADICSKCSQIQIRRMNAADCFKRDLREIPQCFKHDIEVLELSYNRIRKISENDLKRYNDLKILYLSDNMITNIEEEAMEDMSSLEILDISFNSFTKIPAVIFHLPSLKTLYMGQNQNINIVDDIENSKPITSPLTYLNIVDNDIRELPDLGLIPTLFFYNISSNNNVKMNTSKFAGICKLKTLYNTNTTALFDDPCECWNLQAWLEKRNVDFKPFSCFARDCTYEISLEDVEIFDKCNELYDIMIKKEHIIKIGVPVAISVVLVILILIVGCIVRKRRQKSNVEDEKSKMAREGLL